MRGQSLRSLTLAIAVACFGMSGCDSAGSAQGTSAQPKGQVATSPKHADTSDSEARAQLCLAIGTWAAAAHYGEHVRRPDLLENGALTLAQERASAAESMLRSVGDSIDFPLARQLLAAERAYRLALNSGSGIVKAEADVVHVLDRLPSRCVFASRAAGPADPGTLRAWPMPAEELSPGRARTVRLWQPDKEVITLL